MKRAARQTFIDYNCFRSNLSLTFRSLQTLV